MMNQVEAANRLRQVSVMHLGPLATSGHRLSCFLRVILSVWILAYYLLANTFFERISPGGFIMEFSEKYSVRMVYFTTTLLSVATIALLRSNGDTYLRVRYPPIWLPVVTFCLSLLLALTTYNQTPEEGRAISSVLIALFAGAIAVRVMRQPQQIIPSVTLVAVIQGIYTIVYQREQINLLVSGTIPRAGGTFADPNQLYLVMLIVIPFTIVGILQSTSNLVRFGYMTASAIEFATILMTYSRGGMLGLALAITTLSYFATRSKRFVIIIFLCSCVLFGVMQMVRTNGSKNAISTSGSDIGRVHLWREGLEQFAAHPITGNGINSFEVTTATKKNSSSTIFHGIDEPKNLLLYWLDEIGIGGALMFALFVWNISSTIKEVPPNNLSAATGAAWISLLAVGLVETPLGPPECYVGNCCFGLLLGVTVVLRNQSKTIFRRSST